MTFEEFEERTIDYLTSYYDGDAELIAGEVKKNNGVILKSITLRFYNENVCPTLYLSTYYEEFLRGKTFADIMEEIISLFAESSNGVDFDFSFMESYDTLKDRILCKLINKEKNKDLLKEVPFVDFLDLAVVFYVIVSDEHVGCGSVLLRNSNIEDLGVDKETLYKDAMRNNTRILGFSISRIEDVLFNIMKSRKDNFDEELFEEYEKRKENDALLPMYILSNQKNIQGAACMLNTDRLSGFADELDSDFFIIPSSVHELILVPDFLNKNVDELKQMIVDVNNNQVPIQEVLSDRLYKFRRNCKCVTFC